MQRSNCSFRQGGEPNTAVTSKPMSSTGKTGQPAFPRLPQNRT